MDGAPFTLGGREFIVPRLRVGTYERALRASDDLAKAKLPDAPTDPAGLAAFMDAQTAFMRRRIDAYLPVMLDILHANYPDLSLDELKDLVSLTDLEEEFAGLLSAAGKRRKPVPPGEAASP